MAVPAKYRGAAGTSKLAARTWKHSTNIRDLHTEPKVTAVAAAGATETLDWKVGVHHITLDQACTVSFDTTSLAAGRYAKIRVWVEQDATGARAVTWPAAVKWPGGVEPVDTMTASTICIWEFETLDAGTVVLGNLLSDAVPNA